MNPFNFLWGSDFLVIYGINKKKISHSDAYFLCTLWETSMSKRETKGCDLM